MDRPSPRQACNPALLWPALAAKVASDVAGLTAKRLLDLAIGSGENASPEPPWTTPNSIALELKTVRLREFGAAAAKATPALLCAPLALHGAAIADLAPAHSLVAALRDSGVARLYLTDWRSATAEMRSLDIDDYLAELNVLVGTIGAPVDLIGLCQGGWMALVYAARFPAKVRRLVLVGAPVDIAAAPSALSALAEATPLATFHELVQLGDGAVRGRTMLKFWGPERLDAAAVGDVLQTDEAIGSAGFAKLSARFENWYAFALDLPGPFFLQCVERLYKRNELAAGSFVALGQKLDLASVKCPIFLLAARDDEFVAPPQLFAVERLVGSPASELGKAIAPCRHFGLFVGKRTLRDVWPRITRWLRRPARSI